MNSIFKILGLGLIATTFMGAKKGVDLFNVAKQLKYSLQGLPKINFTNRSIKINLKVVNPTNILFNSTYFSIDNITLGLPNNEPIAITTKSINNITINPNGYIVIKDIEFIVNLSFQQIIQLASELRNLELKLDIKFKNQPIKNITLQVADFI